MILCCRCASKLIRRDWSFCCVLLQQHAASVPALEHSTCWWHQLQYYSCTWQIAPALLIQLQLPVDAIWSLFPHAEAALLLWLTKPWNYLLPANTKYSIIRQNIREIRNISWVFWWVLVCFLWGPSAPAHRWETHQNTWQNSEKKLAIQKTGAESQQYKRTCNLASSIKL